MPKNIYIEYPQHITVDSHFHLFLINSMIQDPMSISRKQKEASMNQIAIDLPLHFGHHMFKKDNDFQLPYDVWWLHFNDMVRGFRNI